VRVDALDHARVEPDPGREQEIAATDHAEIDMAGGPVARQPEQVLGRIDDVRRDSEHAAVDVGAPAGQAGQRCACPGEAVGGLVDGAVAAERDDRVIALLGGLAADLGGVVAAFGVDRVDGVGAAQRRNDQVLEPAGDGCRVRVDDHQQALAFVLIRTARVGQKVN
jgi:hypothetical protein